MNKKQHGKRAAFLHNYMAGKKIKQVIFECKNFEDMPLIISERTFTEEEYIQYELQSDIRHEYVNGKLIEMAGESDLHNEIAMNIAILLRQILKGSGYSIYMEGVKIKLPDEPKYYYPDVFATKEITGSAKQYIKYQPEMIVEVLSETTRKYDMVDKFINYQKIPSLVYYMLVEPEKTLVQLFYKMNNDWEILSFTGIEDVVTLLAWNKAFTLKEVYKPA